MHVCVYIHMRKNEYQIQGGGAKERHGGADRCRAFACRSAHTPCADQSRVTVKCDKLSADAVLLCALLLLQFECPQPIRR